MLLNNMAKAGVMPSKESLTSTGELMLTRFSDELLDTHFENGSDGRLYKMELIYYPLGTVDGSPESNSEKGSSIRPTNTLP